MKPENVAVPPSPSTLMMSPVGLRPLQAGMALLPSTLVQLGAAMQVARLSRRWGSERVLAVGMALTAAGMAWLAQIGPHSDYWTGVALPMVLLGIGQGLTLSPLTLAGVSGVAPQDAGAASGLVNASHQLGGSLGLAVRVVSAAGAGLPGGAVADLAHRIAMCLGVSAALLAAAFLVVLTCVVPRSAPAQRPASAL